MICLKDENKNNILKCWFHSSSIFKFYGNPFIALITSHDNNIIQDEENDVNIKNGNDNRIAENKNNCHDIIGEKRINENIIFVKREDKEHAIAIGIWLNYHDDGRHNPLKEQSDPIHNIDKLILVNHNKEKNRNQEKACYPITIIYDKTKTYNANPKHECINNEEYDNNNGSKNDNLSLNQQNVVIIEEFDGTRDDTKSALITWFITQSNGIILRHEDNKLDAIEYPFSCPFQENVSCKSIDFLESVLSFLWIFKRRYLLFNCLFLIIDIFIFNVIFIFIFVYSLWFFIIFRFYLPFWFYPSIIMLKSFLSSNLLSIFVK